MGPSSARQFTPPVVIHNESFTVAGDLISVILPTFNRRDLLAEATASVQAQSYPDWELIVVDDGSTDGSVESLPSDQRISVVRRPHTGNVAALHNAGLERARGSLVAFLDSDDRWLPHKLAAQAARLAARPDCGWCYGRYRLIDANGGEVPQKSGFAWVPREGPLLREIITTEAGVSMITVIVRRGLADRLRFDESVPWGDDYEFLLRLAMTSAACAVDEVIAEAREHAGRGTNHRYDQMLNFARIYARGTRRITDPGLRRLCRQRGVALLREYLAHARAAGELGHGLKAAVSAWWRG
jgi:glycosyltransferase involved in cell wall biosynthesis